MIAIDPPVRFLTFLLHPRGRPHMARRAVPCRQDNCTVADNCELPERIRTLTRFPAKPGIRRLPTEGLLATRLAIDPSA